MTDNRKRKLSEEDFNCSICSIPFEQFVFHQRKFSGEYYKTCPICREANGLAFEIKPSEKTLKGYCPHNKARDRCVECHGVGICVHNKNKRYCRDCNGKAFCEHGKVKYSCKECGGASLCKHLKIKRDCRICRKRVICRHQTLRKECNVCTPTL